MGRKGVTKEAVYILPLPTTLKELKTWATEVCAQTVTSQKCGGKINIDLTLHEITLVTLILNFIRFSKHFLSLLLLLLLLSLLF
jgi:hypothetical protein